MTIHVPAHRSLQGVRIEDPVSVRVLQCVQADALNLPRFTVVGAASFSSRDLEVMQFYCGMRRSSRFAVPRLLSTGQATRYISPG